MRLLVLTKDFPPDVGGIQTYCLELSLVLARQIEHVHVVAPHVPGWESVDRSLPFRVQRVRCTRSSFVAASLLYLRQLLDRERIDTVLAAQWQAALPALAFPPSLRSYQVFIAVHGRELLTRHYAHLPLIGRSYVLARRFALARADALLPVSCYALGLVDEACLTYRQATVVTNGCDPDRFRRVDASNLREKLGLADRRIVTTVGRLVPRKGVDTMLHALRAIVRAVPNVVYLVAGDGPDRTRLEQMAAQLDLRDAVRFLGHVSEDQKVQLYSLSDLFVLPAREERPDVEGFGLVFLEAAACGVPCVGTWSGGVPEAVRHDETGVLVPPRDSNSLARAVVDLLHDAPRRNRLSEAARRFVLTRATWEHKANELVAAMTLNRSDFPPNATPGTRVGRGEFTELSSREPRAPSNRNTASLPPA